MKKWVVVYQAGPDRERREFDRKVEAEEFYRRCPRGTAHVVTVEVDEVKRG